MIGAGGSRTRIRTGRVFCEGKHEGSWGPFRAQDVTPRMHLTDSDFENFTHGGKLCGSKGELGPKEFERVMREQVPPASPLSTPPPPLGRISALLSSFPGARVGS